MVKGIIYYTDNTLGDPIFSLVQKYIGKSRLPITSSSLKPTKFGNNKVIKGERGYPTMVKQIISCLERSHEKYVFFCEHDVLYHKSHFDFTPIRNDIFYYNVNVWRWKHGSKKLIRHDRMISLSGLCADRKFVLDHYRKRLRMIVDRGWEDSSGGEPKWARVMGYEPGTKKKKRGGITNDDYDVWMSDSPNIDIRHGGTFSMSKTKISEFKHPPKWWKEIPIDKLSGWDIKLSEL